MVSEPASPQASRWLRPVALAALGLVAIHSFARPAPVPPPEIPAAFVVVATALGVFCFLAFLAAFLRAMAERPVALPTRRAVALLLAQTVAGLLVSPELLYVVAAEAPFVLAQRPARRWLLVQLGAALAFCLLAVRLGEFEVSTELAELPARPAIALTILTLLVWQLFAFTVGAVAASERRGREQLARANAELAAGRELAAQASRTDERLAISRELHDTLGHHLTVLSVDLEAARHLAGEAAAEPLADAQEVARRLLADLRAAVATLREDRALDLGRALAGLARATRRPDVELVLPDLLPPLDAARAHTLFRCAQEALTNAVRHAGARHVRVELGREGAALALSVHDDGTGQATVRPGLGLTGMRERLEALGGRLDLESAPGSGLTLRAVLPLATQPP